LPLVKVSWLFSGPLGYGTTTLRTSRRPVRASKLSTEFGLNFDGTTTAPGRRIRVEEAAHVGLVDR
jgi:hypothetical protein